jgi:hemolysin activation/secretion protein
MDSRWGAAGVVIASWLMCATGGTLRAQETRPSTSPSTRESIHRNVYPISRFEIEYNRTHPKLPAVEEIMSQPFELGVMDDAYVVPTSLVRQWVKLQMEAEGKPMPEDYQPPQIPTRRITLNQLNDEQVDKFHFSAIWAIYDQIRAYLNKRDIVGVYVAPDEKDIGKDETDRRPPDRNALKLIIYAGVVKDVRTVASGDRVPTDQRLNNDIHKRIRDESPVKPTSVAPEQDLLRRDLLDQYVYSLNRHPGRHVDVAVSAYGDEPGSVVLDYLVSEAKPWAVYAQISNTGTEDTSEWRERFGFVHNQLTNNDDILTLDYVTAGFQDSHLITTSYEAPVFKWRKLRYRVYGLYSQFTASDVGLAQENFDGQQYEAGGELIYNIYQRRDLFVDLFGGARYERVRVDNRDLDVTGEAGFVVPYGGVRVQWLRDIWSIAGELSLQGRFTGASDDDLNALGRFEADKNAVVLQYQLNQSIYLEPLLNKKRFESAKSTLAHELVASVRGQWSPDRLIPQAQEVIGGLYSVRGYEESVAAGDSSVVATAEYRLHVPSLYSPAQPTKAFPLPIYGDKPFKWVPQTAYGKPDWDLIVRGFVDAGWTFQSDPFGFEHDQTLIGVGVGVELQIRQNFNVRLDWGFPLRDLRDVDDQPDNRLHVSASILF